jgi:hypothetical protein
VAMGTGQAFEAFDFGVPFLVGEAKPWLIAHGNRAFAKRVVVAAWGRSGVVAGYEKNSWERGARETPWTVHSPAGVRVARLSL